jgi:hypothetical protein
MEEINKKMRDINPKLKVESAEKTGYMSRFLKLTWTYTV